MVLLELAILGLLLESPMHGYELRKRLTGLLGAFRAFSYGSLYPTLRRMQADGLIAEDAGADGTVKRRARRVYELTPAGRKRFSELVADTGPQNYTDDGFGVHLAFFSRTPAEARMRILEGRRRQVEERREGLRDAVGRATGSLDRYTRQLHQLGLESSEREVRWLNELIAAEQSSQQQHPRRKKENPTMGENSTAVRVAIVGVGNCASSLVQGVQYYKDADENSTVPGLMHVTFGQYHVRDVQFVAAFDVDAKKVGFDLSEAINASENNTIKIADVPPLDVPVQRGPTLDGIGKYYAQTIEVSDAEPVDVVKVLKDAQVDVLVSYLPVGSEEADKFYAQCAIDAGVAFVNALPVFIASDPEWAEKFRAAGVPIVGDDIKSQVGATITHRVMAKLFEDRGVVLDRTYQLNVGGNMDFKNMLERERLESKKVSKTQAVTSNLEGPLAGKVHDRNVHIGPSDYVEWLDDRKWAYVRLEGRAFGDAPLNLEYKLEVWDSPNSAGIIIDAIRAAKIAKDRGLGGPILPASAYLMKSPPVQMADDKARAELEAFIIEA
ncbi:inositol-3-phosphate synthase [Rhodococcus hoagii]|nr:inositol-3-phosphate synthase [Prescottella equi]